MTIKKGNVSLELRDVAIFTMLSPYSKLALEFQYCSQPFENIADRRRSFLGENQKGPSSDILPEAHGYHGISLWRTRRPGNR